MSPIKNIIIHHEAGSNGFWGVNEYHRQLWNFKSLLGYYMGYNYYIDKSGKVWQARTDGEETAHTKDRNFDSLGICLEGNFDYELPNTAQKLALRDLLNRKMTEHAVAPNNIFPHRDYARKSCPGWRWTTSDIRSLFQPDVSYIQAMIDYIKRFLDSITPGKLRSSSQCITLDSRG